MPKDDSTASPLGRFLVVVGIDGSGKTGLLSSLAGAGIVTSSWRDLRSHEVPQVTASVGPAPVKARLAPIPRSMFVGGHLVAQYEYLVRPYVQLGTDVLLDSYWYKVLAKERIVGQLHPSLTELCRSMPVPDGVIFLDADPSVAFRRKGGQVSDYEYLGSPDLDGFTRFQRRLREEILAELAAVPVVRHVDANADYLTVLARATAVLTELLATQCQAVR